MYKIIECPFFSREVTVVFESHDFGNFGNMDHGPRCHSPFRDASILTRL